MNKAKKILIIILIVLVLAVIIIATREFILWKDIMGLDKSNAMSREEAVALLDKGSTQSNYYYSTTSSSKDTVPTKNYIKDNINYSYIDSDLDSVSNSNTGEVTRYWNNEETKYTKEDINKNNQHGVDYSIVPDYNTFKMDYEYLGKKQEGDRTFIFIKMIRQKDNIYSDGGSIFKIDEETGLIFERITFVKKFYITTNKYTSNMNITFDVQNDDFKEKTSVN